MSEENVALVQRLLEMFANREHEAVFEFYDPDIERIFEVEDVRDGGDEIVALICNQRQWGRRSGIPIDMPPYGLVFTIRDRKVVRWRSFRDQQSALEAAGLSE